LKPRDGRCAVLRPRPENLPVLRLREFPPTILAGPAPKLHPGPDAANRGGGSRRWAPQHAGVQTPISWPYALLCAHPLSAAVLVHAFNLTVHPVAMHGQDPEGPWGQESMMATPGPRRDVRSTVLPNEGGMSREAS
jgi:hypothetical protein